MLSKSWCCCGSKTETPKDTNTEANTVDLGTLNTSFESFEPTLQKQTNSSASTVIIDSPPELSKSVRSSVGSCDDKVSKIDLNLNIFENQRFADMSEQIHKSLSESEK